MTKKKNGLLKWLGIAIAVLLVIGIIGKKAGWIGKEEKTAVAVEKAIKRNITEIVSASGKIQPEVEVKITPDVSGEIVELKVIEGQPVKKGDLLLRILPDIYQSNVDRTMAGLNASKTSFESAKARVVQAESQLKRAESSYERNKRLYDEKLISANEFEVVKSSYEVAKAELEAAKESVRGANFNIQSAAAGVKESQDNLRKTSIFAPVDGTISRLNKEKGERVVGTNMMEGTEIMVIANLNEMEVSVDVNENDIIRVSVGDSADVEVDAYQNKKFKGIVTEVANSSTNATLNIDQVINFKVKVRILRESYQELEATRNGKSVFNPGMSATVDIHTNSVSNVIAVPIQAVTTRDTSIKKFSFGNDGELQDESVQAVNNTSDDKNKKVELVFVVNDGKVKWVPVKSGIQDNSFIEIISGLKEGDQVVIAPYSAITKDLFNNDAVEIKKKSEVYSKKE
ncbi:MAG: hypothetical protein RIQ89_771 [Bacteroidota bacterium]|jgi:HlyD family secretion protein